MITFCCRYSQNSSSRSAVAFRTELWHWWSVGVYLHGGGPGGAWDTELWDSMTSQEAQLYRYNEIFLLAGGSCTLQTTYRTTLRRLCSTCPLALDIVEVLLTCICLCARDYVPVSLCRSFHQEKDVATGWRHATPWLTWFSSNNQVPMYLLCPN